VLASALVALLAIAAVASAASAPPKKGKKPTSLCRLGQNTQKASCAPNRLFSKDVCSAYLPQMQALDPGQRIVTAGNRYGPVFNVVGCYYTVGGTPQGIYFTVNGGAHFHTNSLVDTKKQIGLQQAFGEEYDQWAIVDHDCDPPVPGTVKTTVEGFRAFTVDLCPPMRNGVAETAGGHVEVLAGTTWVIIGARPGYSVTSSSQLIPFAEQLIAKYH
jgi:hypothetical protein